VKTRCNLAESSIYGYGSKGAVLSMMMMVNRKYFETGGHDLFEGIMLAFAWKDFEYTILQPRIPQSEQLSS
jgi:hypothetical protein